MKYKLELHNAKNEYSDRWEYLCEKIFNDQDEEKAKVELFLLYLAQSDFRKKNITRVNRKWDKYGVLKYIELEYVAAFYGSRECFYSYYFKFKKFPYFDKKDTFKDLLTHENGVVRKFIKETLAEE